MIREPVSICLATYNGERYIREQIESIISELNNEDEIIISDDCSKDSTLKIIKKFKDKRIKIYTNKVNTGHIKNFEKAITYSQNNIIFLSDQDDVWLPGRLNLMLESLRKSKCLLVTSNFLLMDQEGVKYHRDPKKDLKFIDSSNHLSNILGIYLSKKSYFGCTMAFKRDLLKIILPIPKFVESHDLWIALAANILKSNLHINENTLAHRLHNNNVTNSKRHLSLKLYSRLVFTMSIIVLFWRKNFISNNNK